MIKNNITEIYLISNIYSKQFPINDLVGLIKKYSVKKLSLSNCSIDFEQLFDKLIDNNSIIDINVSHNVISDGGYTNMSKYLQTSTKIRRLNVWSINHFTHQTIAKLTDGLMGNRSLTHLDLLPYEFQIPIRSVEILNEIATKNRMLQTIENHKKWEGKLKDNLEKNRKLAQIKMCMLMLRKTKNCIVSTMPRRLLIYLFEYLDVIF